MIISFWVFRHLTYASLCQDVMILDQSVLFGVADIHDRHRDMRLDVDNMSYEVTDTTPHTEKKTFGSALV